MIEMELEKKENFRYLRVYNYYKDLILNEKMTPGTRLPSIRNGASQFQMSRTTMESAYLLLAAEGYIVSRPQSGYYVTEIARKQKQATKQLQKKEKKQEIKYDFLTSGVDKESFHFELWRRYMKSALRQSERLLSYGEPQGEEEFREVLCRYLQEHRRVICTPEQIVVGAGVQSLLHILCPLIKERETISFYNPNFKQGITIFEDYGFQQKESYQDAKVYYITPSQMSEINETMSAGARLELIKEASRRDLLLIEDDYNHEFRYFQRTIPSIQGLAGGRGVVYLGSFSKLLLPSIRMSFMVLPLELLELYEKKIDCYNQTASKAEQIALTQFIRDGHLESQIRKSRKIHLARAGELASAAREVWGEDGRTQIQEDGFGILLELESRWTLEELGRRLQKEGIIARLVGEADGKLRIYLMCTNVEPVYYREVLQKIREIC